MKIASMFISLLKKLLPVLIILVLVFWAWGRWKGWPSPAGWFTSQPVIIDETPILISEIKTIAELHTAKLYCEVITDSVVLSTTDMAINALRDALAFPPASGTFSMTKKLVLVAKGQVIAGLDLSQLTEKDFTFKKDSVWLRIPTATILDVITNPSDFEIFLEEGTWTFSEVALVKQKAVTQMELEAEKRALLMQANNRAMILMKNFLNASGFAFADVQIK